MREDWVECTFEDVIENISTSNYKIKQKDYISDGEIPVVDQGQELIGGYFNNKENIIPVELPVVVFGDHTKCVKYINFHFVPGADGTKVLKVDDNISTKYIYYLLKVLVFKIEDKGYARHFQFLQKELIPLPPLPEQRAIVKKIEALFSSLDAGIADLKKAQEQLKIYRQAVLKKAFEGELDNNSVSTKVNKIYATISSTRYLTRLGSVISLQGGYAFKSSEFTSEGIPIVKIANVNLDNINWDEVSYVSNERLEEFKNYSLTEGDVLIAMTRPVIKSLNTVKTVIVKRSDLPCLLNQRVGRFLIKGNKITKEYLQYYIKSTFFKDPIVREANDSLLPNISGKTIENFDIILPLDFNEQAQIVKEIESRLSVCDAVEQQIKDSLSQAEALRQSILKKAFEGRLLSEAEVTACQQEPDYEPASVLLEKIKVEKEALKPVKKSKKK